MRIPERIYLRKEDIKRIKEVEPILDWLAEEIARAERAGLDVSDLRKEYERVVRLKEGLLREYTPPELQE